MAVLSVLRISINEQCWVSSLFLECRIQIVWGYSKSSFFIFVVHFSQTLTESFAIWPVFPPLISSAKQKWTHYIRICVRFFFFHGFSLTNNFSAALWCVSQIHRCMTPMWSTRWRVCRGPQRISCVHSSLAKKICNASFFYET